MLLATTTSSAALVPVSNSRSSDSIGRVENGFRWEVEMTRPVVGEVQRLLPRGREPQLVLGEVPAAVGVVDVLATQFNTDAIRHRLTTGVGPICSPLRVRVLDCLRNRRPWRVATIAARVGSNPRALTRSTLRPLAKLGLVELTERSVLTTGAWVSVGSHLTAVELKLNKWRSALRQADNFAISADRSWVVLDEARARGAVASANYFAQVGVGLALLTPEGELRIIVRPGRRHPERWLKALMTERAWAVAESELAAVIAEI